MIEILRRVRLDFKSFYRWFGSNTNMSASPPVNVRRLDTDTHLSISFVYKSQFINERRFNFSRLAEEKLSATLSRISQNVLREVEKKMRKIRNKKAKTGLSEATETKTDEAKVTVELYDINGRKFDDDLPAKDGFVVGSELVVGEAKFRVRVNPPTITTISLPKCIMAGFPVHPQMETEFCTSTDCTFEWHREVTTAQSNSFFKPESEIAGHEMAYLPTTADIGRRLKVEAWPTSAKEDDRKIEAISLNPIEGGPGECPFDRRHAFTKTVTPPGELRVMSYNLLADLYADSDFSRQTLFPTCPAYALNIDYRKQLLLKEIEGYNADVICMQEVDKKMFVYELVPALEPLGLTGHYTSKGGKVAEGVATFVRDSKLKFVSEHSAILSELIMSDDPPAAFADIADAVRRNEKLFKRMAERTTAVQVLCVESRDVPNLRLCIANTHLYFHPEADHIRLLQVGMCIRQVEHVVAMETAKNPHCKAGVIICGDFNSTPEYGIFQLMTTQYIPEDYPHWKSVEEEAVTGLSLSQPFNLVSACGTPAYTNYTTGFNGCLDYIFTDASSMEVKEVVPMPTHEEVTQYGALPSVTMPSDHIALVCTVALKK